MTDTVVDKPAGANETNVPKQSTLSEQMTAAREGFITSQSEKNKAIIGPALEKLMVSDFGSAALKVGDSIPDFSLPNAKGETIAIADFISNGPIVLSFYRGGWCPFCNLEFKALSDALSEINRLGASLIGISPELPDVAQATISKHEIPFDVMSDVGNKISREFGLIMEVYEEMRPLYLEWGLDIPSANGDESWELPIPATYVIDKKGIIRGAFVNKDYTQRMEPTEIIVILKTLV